MLPEPRPVPPSLVLAPSVSALMRRVMVLVLSSVPLQLPPLHTGPLSTQVALAVKQLTLSGAKLPQIVKYCVPSAVARALSNVGVASSGIGIAVLLQLASG